MKVDKDLFSLLFDLLDLGNECTYVCTYNRHKHLLLEARRLTDVSVSWIFHTG